MSTDRWEEILSAAATAESNWGILPENTWGATIAYAAGPGRVRPHLVPLEDRRVRMTIHDADGTRHVTETLTQDDIEMIEETINLDLAEIGLPPSPHTWWEIAMPDAMSIEDVERLICDATAAVSAGLQGVEVARAEAPAIFAAVRRLYE